MTSNRPFTDEWIAQFVEPRASVLDIGCGEGSLLAFLEAEREVKGQGIDVDPNNVRTATGRGLPVIHADADEELANFPDNSFDIAVLARTVQAMKDPKEVLDEALRIAGKVVVVIPNFGYISNRFYLLFKGEMPVTSDLAYQWHETPNIHFCTARDMIALASLLGAKIEKRYTLSRRGKLSSFIGKGSLGANLFGRECVFVLSR